MNKGNDRVLRDVMASNNIVFKEQTNKASFQEWMLNSVCSIHYANTEAMDIAINKIIEFKK